MTSKRYERKTCEGSIYIIVNRDDNGKFCSILIYPPAKENNCGYSWAFAVQDLITFALKRAEGQKELRLIHKALSGQICNAMPPNKDHCKSCPDAIAQVLKKEFFIE
jgi:hypothetical protein